MKPFLRFLVDLTYVSGLVLVLLGVLVGLAFVLDVVMSMVSH